MQKLFQLHRLNFDNKMLVLKYLFKRIFKIATSERERIINDYYYHLIMNKGILKVEEANAFISFYPKYNATIKTRKRPSSDLDVFSQVFNDLEYQPVVTTFKKHFPNHNGINIIDAGSNIGLTSLYFSRFFDNANYICIEPDDSNFESMRYNLENNKVQNLVKVKGGLWSKNTFLSIVRDFRDKNDWAIRVEETSDNTNLEAFSIDYLIKKNQFEVIDILKIDIEGSEKEVLTGNLANLSYLSITKCIAIEIHDEFNCRQAIYKILEDHNFTYFDDKELTIGVNQNLI
jgi:FkbM family methyltransferase